MVVPSYPRCYGMVAWSGILHCALGDIHERNAARCSECMGHSEVSIRYLYHWGRTAHQLLFCILLHLVSQEAFCLLGDTNTWRTKGTGRSAAQLCKRNRPCSINIQQWTVLCEGSEGNIRPDSCCFAGHATVDLRCQWQWSPKFSRRNYSDWAPAHDITIQLRAGCPYQLNHVLVHS